jgi:hypothetical protein
VGSSYSIRRSISPPANSIRHVGHAVNSPAYENYPSVAANGTLYFAGEREGGKGGNDHRMK